MKLNQAVTQNKPVKVRAGRPLTAEAAERSQAILDAATAVFLERGFSRASTTEIARRAGASKQTLYARYPTKSALFAALMERRSEKMLSSYSDLFSLDAPVDRVLLNYGKKLVATLLYSETRLLYRLVVAEAVEFPVSSSADRFLRRGFACLALDGPGQGECLTRGLWYDPDTYGKAGTSAYEYLTARPEVDAAKIMAMGVSFGSYWVTQMTAAEPRFAACAVTYTCFQPQNFPLLQMASPTFKQRLMYMTGIREEAAFDSLTEKFDVQTISAQIKVPYLVLAGEDDELSDIGYTVEHLNRVSGPMSLMMYAGGVQEIGPVPSYLLGPFNFVALADWFRDRADGRPMASEYTVVDSTGQAHTEPWGENRVFEYSASLGFRHLFGDSPMTGTA